MPSGIGRRAYSISAHNAVSMTYYDGRCVPHRDDYSQDVICSNAHADDAPD